MGASGHDRIFDCPVVPGGFTLPRTTEWKERGAMDVVEIMKILPHRYPMLLVDRVLECDDKERIVGIKNLTATEQYFQGHFPDDPVMPGVFQLEAMAQVAGILINRISRAEGAIAYFLAVDNARFRKVLRPGDQLRIEVHMVRSRSKMWRVHGQVLVEGEVACEADLMFGRKE
jgi:3-hydroxyacyl-[acyl-carrier-protein] dehydratase